MNPTIRLCRYAVFVIAMFVLVGVRSRLVSAAMPQNCSDICTSDEDCSTQCLYNYDSEETCGDWGTCAPDCSDVCGPTVDCYTACSGDGYCGAYNGGKSNLECYGTCGDGTCDLQYETYENCPADCQFLPGDGIECDIVTGDGCSAGQFCLNGQCAVGCDSDDCGGTSRSCEGGAIDCTSDDQCCDDEACVDLSYWWVYGNDGGYFGTSGPLCMHISESAPLPMCTTK